MIRSARQQQGFSLIEMMLAFVIGLIVAGSALQLMLSNSRSASVNEFMATAQENGRHSLYVMSRELRRAGYRTDAQTLPAEPFYTGKCQGAAVCTQDGGGTVSDRVAIQYEPQVDPNTGDRRDCAGGLVPDGALTADVYYVAVDAANNDISTLFCIGYDPVSETARAPGNPLALVQGVERLQAVYGVGPAGTTIIDKYVTASAVSNWQEVRGIRVGVLVSAGDSSRVFDQRIRTYNLLNSGSESFNDQTPRYVYSTAVRLNNTGLIL